MSQLRCAVVGVGYLGKFHAQKYKLIENCDLIGVCDLNEENAKAVGNDLSVPAFSDYKKLLGGVDAVTVASTTSSHFEVAKFFLENGVHVNVEKPMTTTSAEGEELCAIAEKNNLKLQVGHVERFNPALASAQEKLNMPLFIECHRLAPFKPRGVDVNVVLDLMIHDLDVVLSLIKSKPVRVDAVGTPVLTKTTDIANARVEFESGTVANITSSRVSLNTQRKFRVFQENQYLSIDFGAGEVSLLTKTGNWQEGSMPIEQETWNLEKGDALLAETQAFVDAINNDTTCVVSGNDGLMALKLAEQIIEDIERKQK